LRERELMMVVSGKCFATISDARQLCATRRVSRGEDDGRPLPQMALVLLLQRHPPRYALQTERNREKSQLAARADRKRKNAEKS